MEMNEAVK